MLKSSIATLAAVAAFTLPAFGAPAVSGTLASYLALGSSGATIGSTLFSDFTLLPLQTGAVQIDPNSVLVSPINLFGNPSLNFAVSQTASTAQLFELRLSYKVADFSITGAAIGLNGSVVNFDGANTALLDVTGPTPPLIAFDIGVDSDPTASGIFSSVATLTAETDIVVDGGTFGGASLTSATARFTVAPVPEPGTALIGVALLGVCLSRTRRCRSQNF